MRLIAFPQWDKLTSLLRGMARQPVLLVIVAPITCHFGYNLWHTEMKEFDKIKWRGRFAAAPWQSICLAPMSDLRSRVIF